MSAVVPNKDPFISKNVWLKGIAGVILLIAFLPVGPATRGILFTILGIVIVMAVITHIVKLLKAFIMSIWKS